MYEQYQKLAQERGVTSYKVAADTGIPRSTFSDWKSGRSEPKIDKIAILARYFGVPIEYFLKGREAK